MKRFYSKKAVIFGTSLSIGFLLLIQWKSFGAVREAYLRDKDPNIFREIQILKTATDQLRQEIEQTKISIAEISKKTSSISSLRDETDRFALLSGEIDIEGLGVKITIPRAVDTVWFVDLQNELVTAGAEAMAVNGIRITSKSAGFRLIPPQTLLIGNHVTRPPFTIEAVGDGKILMNALLQPGGVIARLEKILGKKELLIKEEEKLKIMGTGA